MSVKVPDNEIYMDYFLEFWWVSKKAKKRKTRKNIFVPTFYLHTLFCSDWCIIISSLRKVLALKYRCKKLKHYNYMKLFLGLTKSKSCTHHWTIWSLIHKIVLSVGITLLIRWKKIKICSSKTRCKEITFLHWMHVTHFFIVLN